MTDIFWLMQNAAQVPRGNDWLSANEAIRLEEMCFVKRRLDWRLGRWTAKLALAVWLNMPMDQLSLATIEIHSTPSGVPEAILGHRSDKATISLSHRAGAAICALAPYGVELGCDLEVIEPRSDTFVKEFLTDEEQSFLAQAAISDRYLLTALAWSAKESTLKAVGAGLRLDTRTVAVDLSMFKAPVSDVSRWNPLRVCQNGSRVFEGWWRQDGTLLQTLVAAPLPNLPQRLPVPLVHTAE
jgi:4'-phosphopantetheinyl transferase